MALRSRSLLASLDMYRKIPADLLEGTKRGSVFSLVSLFIIMILMVLETKSYLRTRIVTDLALLKSSFSKGKKIILNFNITMLDLKCDFISMDQVSVFGSLQNVNQHIRMRTIDQLGIKRPYSSTASTSASLKMLLDRNSNKSSGDLKLYDPTVTETLQELTKEGENAVRLSQDTFSQVIQKHRFVFVDFFADWCSHCRDLAPTWEKLAMILNAASVDIAKQRLLNRKDELERESPHFLDETEHGRLQHAEIDVFRLPVLIAKVDCVEHHEFCRTQNIVAYPTIQLYVNGKKYGGDYYGHRTVLDFTDYLATVEEEELAASGEVKRGTGDLSKAHIIAQQIRHKEISAYESALVGGHDDVEGYYRSEPEENFPSFLPNRKLYDNKIHKEWVQKDHPGCEVSGFLLLDPVPGNFYIFAKSETLDLVPHMTNLSHEINSMSFTPTYIHTRIGHANSQPPDFLLSKSQSMNGNAFIQREFHEAYHHYMKLVASSYVDSTSSTTFYQMLHQSQLALYNPDIVPVAKFQYDFSPVQITYRKLNNRQWYEYVTSLLAIIGGMFTVIGMIESVLHVISLRGKNPHHHHMKAARGY